MSGTEIRATGLHVQYLITGGGCFWTISPEDPRWEVLIRKGQAGDSKFFLEYLNNNDWRAIQISNDNNEIIRFARLNDGERGITSITTRINKNNFEQQDAEERSEQPYNEPDLTDLMLSEREKSHGDPIITGQIYERLCEALTPVAVPRTAIQTYAIDMIAVKLARICAGDPSFEDHWKDIEGYARLALNELQ